jgi:hypothetical protein
VELTGTLAFGDVTLGTSSTTTLTINNTGNSPLSIAAITGTSGVSAVIVPNWNGGTIASNGSQDVLVRFTPASLQRYSGTLTVNGDQTGGISTIGVSGAGVAPPGGLTQFDAGQYVVGKDIAAGRYFSAPGSGCYWERESGLGGTPAEIIANNFSDATSRQWIVDILRSDEAFKTAGSCGAWNTSPRVGLQPTIAPGMYLVGTQITPGTYRVSHGANCYWERVRNFEGTLDGVVANSFVSSPGSAVVTIANTDVGFDTDSDCGTWSPVFGLVATSIDAGSRQTRGEIEWNRNRARMKLRN